MLACLAVGFVACDNDDDNCYAHDSVRDASTGVYVLNNGNMGSNNGSITYFNVKNNNYVLDIFETENGGSIGDLAQGMVVYGSKIYVSVAQSSKIEVLEKNGKSIKNIPVLEGETPAQPRYITSGNGYVYFTAYDGNVRRIDTTTLEIADKVAVGAYPEAISFTNNKLFVNISGYGSGNTVSVIDAHSFSVVKEIVVPQNPYSQSIVGSDGNIYIVSCGDYGDIKSQAVRINPVTYEVTSICEASYIAEHDSKLFTIYSVYDDSWNLLPPVYNIIDLTADTVLVNDFISNVTYPNPLCLNIDPSNGDIYLGEGTYGASGDMTILNSSFEFQKKYNVGYYPAGSFFVNE